MQQGQQSPGPSVAAAIFGHADAHASNGSAGGPPKETRSDRVKTLLDCLARDLRSQRIVLSLMYGMIIKMGMFIVLHTLLAFPEEEGAVVGEKETVEESVEVKENKLGYWSVVFSLGIRVVGYALRLLVSPFLSSHFLGIAFASCTVTAIIGYRMQAQEHCSASLKEYLSSLVSLRLWFELTLCGFLASFMGNCYVHAFNWESKNITFASHLLSEGHGSTVFLNDDHLFLCVMAFAVGVHLYVEWSRGLKGGFTLEFPTIPLKPVEVIRNNAIELFSETFAEMISLVPILYCLVYFLYRVLVIRIVLAMGYNVDPNNALSLFSVGMWIQSGFLCFLIAYIFQLLYVVVQVTMTEELDLSIASLSTANSNQLLLTDAMNCVDKYLQHLGFHTFKMSANPFRPGVTQFYELSHPGSHPRNWNNICNATLQVCDNLRKELTDFLIPKKPSSNDLPSALRPSAYLLTTRIPTESDTSEMNRRKSLRNWNEQRSPTIRFLAASRSSPASDPVNEDSASYLSIILMSPLLLIKSLLAKLKAAISRRFAWASKLKDIWEKPKPELDIANILSTYQLVLWGVNGLVEVICMSKKLDRHGVVQRDMSRILHKFIDIYQTLLDAATDSRLNSSSVAKVELISQSTFYAIAKIHVRFARHYEMLRVDKDYQIYAAEIAKMDAQQEILDYGPSQY